MTAMLCLQAQGSPAVSGAARRIPPVSARVDINRASVEELLKIQGMTRTWAVRIVRFRPYRTKQDLVDRGVLSSDVYQRVKEQVIAHRGKE